LNNQNEELNSDMGKKSDDLLGEIGALKKKVKALEVIKDENENENGGLRDLIAELKGLKKRNRKENSELKK